MLRAALMGLGLVSLSAAAGLLFLAGPVAIGPAVLGTLIVGGLLLERHRYHATADHPPGEPGWEMLAERFVDQDTDELTIVWYNRRTGKRLYVRSGHV